MSLPNVATIVAEDQTISIETVQTGVSVVVPEVTEIVITTEAGLGPVVKELVTGPQGPAGLQNVYVQTDDPAIEYGWGMEQKDFIWIPV